MNEVRSRELGIVARFRAERRTDLRALADALGLEVACHPLPAAFAATLEPLAGHERFRLVLNADHAPARRRFTLAHMMGHYVLHRELIGAGLVEGRTYRSVGWGYCHNTAIASHEEIEANRFAASLSAGEAGAMVRTAVRLGVNDPFALAVAAPFL